MKNFSVACSEQIWLVVDCFYTCVVSKEGMREQMEIRLPRHEYKAFLYMIMRLIGKKRLYDTERTEWKRPY